MTLRLGFVGVGRWGQKLATAFRACGAEIVAHSRNDKSAFGYVLDNCGGGPSLPGFGLLRHDWREMLEDKHIDAIIAVAPPEITTEVALACAAAGKPVMATKPLFDHPETIRSVFYVDFWRLWAQSRELSLIFRANFPQRPLVIELHGSGPFRDFPGMFDWGPHVVAQLLDTFRNGEPVYDQVGKDTNEAGGELFTVNGRVGDREFTLVFGNGSAKPTRQMMAGNIYVGIEEGTMIGTEEKSAVLQRFCQSFLNDISEGFVDTRLLELSRRGMAELRKIREMAK